jgi:hypothetical protein
MARYYQSTFPGVNGHSAIFREGPKSAAQVMLHRFGSFFAKNGLMVLGDSPMRAGISCY